MSYRFSKEDLDSQFDAFLRDSVSSEESLNKYLKKPVTRERKPVWFEDDDNDKSDMLGTGLSPSGKSFLKSKKPETENEISRTDAIKSDSILKEKSKKDVGKGRNLKGKSELTLSRDSLEDISEKSEIESAEEKKKMQNQAANFSLDSASKTSLDNVNKDNISTDGPGIDTLDELVDKEKFFQGLEDNGDQSVDYHRLIGEMSGTTNNPGDTNNKVLQTLNQSDNKINAKQDEYSFEKDSSHQKPSMLSKVSLLDSMDSTLNTTTSPKVARSRDPDLTGDNLGLTVPGLSKMQTGTEFMGTNTSKEIEDLHQAMREVGMSTATTGPQDRQLDNTTASSEQLVNQLFQANGKERPVSEIFRDIDNIEAKRDDQKSDVKLLSEYKTQTQTTQHYKIGSQSSVSEEVKIDQGGFDNSHTEDTEVYQPVIAVSVKDKKTLGDSKKVSKSRSKYNNIQSSGYGKRSPSVSPIISPTRPLTDRSKKLSKSSPDIAKHRYTSSKAHSKIRYDVKSDKKDHEQLLASVDSFARYIKGQINGKQLPEVKWSKDEPSQSSSIKLDKSGVLDREQVLLQELKDLQQQWQQIRNENVTVKADMASQQKLHVQEIENIRLAHEKELYKIKQENFVLVARNQAEGEQKQIVTTQGLDYVAKERITKLEKEIQEQETLIAGYQQENQRFYSEVKRIGQNTKETEGSMFKENQKLAREVAQLRDDLSQKEYQLKHKGIITSVKAQQEIAGTGGGSHGNQAVLGAGKIAELEMDLKDVTKQYGISQRELQILQKTKLEIEQHLDLVIKEREDLAKQLNLSKTLRPEEARVIEDKYQQEIDKLTRKLKWYAENQELLDKGALTIKNKDILIEKLKKQVEDLQTETGQRLEENKMRAKERGTDSKKMQDLERQIKEMDQIIRRRHPNSLPAMILAAGIVPDSNQDKKTPSNIVLENRIKKLEGELASKDSESDQLLRAVEQKYNTVKMQYEARIQDLESQLSRFQRPGDPLFTDYDHPHTHVAALQKELDSTRDRYKKQIVDLHSDVLKLQTELQKSTRNSHQGISRLQDSTDSELHQHVLQLQQEVENKSHDMTVLQKSLDKLRKEKHLYFKTHNIDISKKSKSKKNGKRLEENGSIDNIQDRNHIDIKIEDVIKENEHLKIKVERLQLSLDQQRVDLRKSLAETEAVVRKSREEYEYKIDTLRSCHQKEFQRILVEQAVNNSTSKVAELHSKCDAQEVLIQHLKEQLSRNEVEAEQISVLKIKQAALVSQVDKLKEELVEAKQNYSPGMKHFVSIQDKINHMERRHEKREEELQDIIKNTQNLASNELDREAAKWQTVVELKNKEIEKFRSELDSILNVIRMLQQQGVVLPLPS